MQSGHVNSDRWIRLQCDVHVKICFALQNLVENAPEGKGWVSIVSIFSNHCIIKTSNAVVAYTKALEILMRSLTPHSFATVNY